MIEEEYLGLKRLEKVDIGLRPATLPTITQMDVVDVLVDMLLLVVFWPGTFLSITVAENKVTQQGPLNMI